MHIRHIGACPLLLPLTTAGSWAICFSLSQFPFLTSDYSAYWCQFIRDAGCAFLKLCMLALSVSEMSLYEFLPQKLGSIFISFCSIASPEVYIPSCNLKRADLVGTSTDQPSGLRSNFFSASGSVSSYLTFPSSPSLFRIIHQLFIDHL